jgi:ribosomal protein S18
MKLINKFRLRKKNTKFKQEKDEKYDYDDLEGMDEFLKESDDFHPDF